ncbi:MAG TPA: hemerythrin domain-containing protein [Vicinamibacterales bacterium]|nr:hemerythrin domain-containing protein [Vicinamibacterales bacterium]
MAVSVRIPAAKAHATLKQVQEFQQAIEDHRYLSEYVANVQHSTALLRESEPRERIASMRAFLAEHVVGHFAFEESHVFPQLLAKSAAPATRRAVEELVDEHKSMMGPVRRLRRKMRGICASGSARDLERLDESFRGFLHVLQAHAIKEDNLLLTVKQARRRAVHLT